MDRALGKRIFRPTARRGKRWRGGVCVAAALFGGALGIIAALTPPAASAEAGARTFELVVRNGRLADGRKAIRVTQGDTVTLRWRLDRAAELHLHGYDLKVAAKPGTVAELSFRARTAGRFSVSAHWADGHGAGRGHARHGESRLLYIDVYPR